TALISKPLSLNSAYAFLRFGCSARQGPHQDDQNSSNTYFPLTSESFIKLPVLSARLTSIIGFPTLVFFAISNLLDISRPSSESFAFSPRAAKNGENCSTSIM